MIPTSGGRGRAHSTSRLRERREAGLGLAALPDAGDSARTVRRNSIKGMVMPFESSSKPPQSADALSSAQAARPFGLSRTTVPTGTGVNVADTAVYDPIQQLNVTPSGVPLVGTELGQLGVTHQNTQADHQHWTDKDQ